MTNLYSDKKYATADDKVQLHIVDHPCFFDRYLVIAYYRNSIGGSNSRSYTRTEDELSNWLVRKKFVFTGKLGE